MKFGYLPDLMSTRNPCELYFCSLLHLAYIWKKIHRLDVSALCGLYSHTLSQNWPCFLGIELGNTCVQTQWLDTWCRRHFLGNFPEFSCPWMENAHTYVSAELKAVYDSQVQSILTNGL